MATRVIQWATGEVGKLTLREIIRNPELELVGVYVYSEAKDGKDAGDIVGLEPVGVTATRDRDAILIVFSITDQAEICVLDPQSASAPAGTALQLLHCPKYGGAL